MKFARIEMLFLIWTVPVFFLIFYFAMKKRETILSRFASPRSLSSITPDIDPHQRWIKIGLVLLAVMFGIIALSGPEYGYTWQKIERRGVDIIIALDCSKSMLARDIKPSRLERAKREIYDLLNMLQGDRIGLVAFSGSAFLQCPLTLDYDAFQVFLKILSPDFLPVGGTDIPAAIKTAISGFNEKEATQKAIILITDGESTTGDPLKAARTAKKAGIKLFCIGVGKKEGVPVPDEQGGFKKDPSGNIILTRLDEETLKKMAVLTGGIYVHSIAGDMDLNIIYKKEIREKMKLSTLSGGRKQVWEDRYQWFLIPAIVMLLIDMFLGTRKKTFIFLFSLCMVFTMGSAEAATTHHIIKKGISAYEKREYQKALKLFIDAQLEKPGMHKIYYNIGNAYYKNGNFAEAWNNYKQALKSKNDKLREATFYNMGNSAFRMGKLKEAKTNYEAALKIDPKDIQAKENLEYVKKVMAEKKSKQNQNNKHKKKEALPEEETQKRDSGKDSQNSKKKKAEAQKTDRQESDKNQTQQPVHPPDTGPGKKQEQNMDLNSKSMPTNRKTPQNRNKEVSGTKHPETSLDKNNSENVLNRLKDMPGRAMIPFYHKQQVEKDW